MKQTRILVALLLAGALGCDPTAMSFSPDGKQIALLTTQDHGTTGVPERRYTVRLAVVTLADKKVRVLDQSDQAYFTSPAFRPNGKAVCYLRIPKPDEEKERAQREERAKRAVALSGKTDQVRKEWGIARDPPRFTEGIIQPLVFGKLMTNPPLANSYKLAMILLGGGPQEVTLIERDVTTGKVLSQTLLRLPLVNIIEGNLSQTAAKIRPKYAPGGKRIYICDGNLLLAVDPAQRAVHVVAAPAERAALSPDGKTIAVYQNGAIGFHHLTAVVSVHKIFQTESEVVALAWKDNQTPLLIVGGARGGTTLEIHPVKSDGSMGETTTVRLDGEALPQPHPIAVSPGGKHMVGAFGKVVLFLDGDGKVLKKQRLKGGFLGAPVFSPDGKTVAMKHMTVPDGPGGPPSAGLKLFSPEGKELLNIAEPKWPERPAGIPKLKPLKTGPPLYRLDRHKSILVLVRDSMRRRGSEVTPAAIALAKRINRLMLQHKITNRVISMPELTAYLEGAADHDRQKMRKTLGADLILEVGLNSFPATKKYTDSQRRVAPMVAIWLVGPSGRIWPKGPVTGPREIIASVPLGKDPLPEKTEKALVEKAWERLAEKISRCFYDTRPPATRSSRPGRE